MCVCFVCTTIKWWWKINISSSYMNDAFTYKILFLNQWINKPEHYLNFNYIYTHTDTSRSKPVQSRSNRSNLMVNNKKKLIYDHTAFNHFLKLITITDYKTNTRTQTDSITNNNWLIDFSVWTTNNKKKKRQNDFQ